MTDIAFCWAPRLRAVRHHRAHQEQEPVACHSIPRQQAAPLPRIPGISVARIIRSDDDTVWSPA
jgi:hypothetical protein